MICASSYLQSIEAHPTSSSGGNGTSDAVDLLNKAINVIGGWDALNSVKGITYHAPKLARSSKSKNNDTDPSIAFSAARP
jgi:hypothetical protein